MSEFQYIAIPTGTAEFLEYAGCGKTVEEAVDNCYWEEEEDDNGEPLGPPIIDVFKYEGSFRKKVETTIEKVD